MLPKTSYLCIFVLSLCPFSWLLMGRISAYQCWITLWEFKRMVAAARGRSCTNGMMDEFFFFGGHRISVFDRLPAITQVRKYILQELALISSQSHKYNVQLPWVQCCWQRLTYPIAPIVKKNKDRHYCTKAFGLMSQRSWVTFWHIMYLKWCRWMTRGREIEVNWIGVISFLLLSWCRMAELWRWSKDLWVMWPWTRDPIWLSCLI